MLVRFTNDWDQGKIYYNQLAENENADYEKQLSLENYHLKSAKKLLFFADFK